MPQIIQILGLPFLACILMGIILSYLGIHILKREIIFIDIALAQIAAVGSIAAHLTFKVHGDSIVAYICAFGCVLLAALFYAVIRNRIIQISIEAIIGVSYAVAAAGALFLVGIAPGGHVHVQQILSGSLLWTNWQDIVLSLFVFSAVGTCFYIFRKPLNRLSSNYERAHAQGLKIAMWDFVFYMLLGIVITLTVQIAGIVVVFAVLIIPATISALFSLRWRIRILISCAAMAGASVAGLLFAYYLDFSIGPAIALFLGGELIIAALYCRQQHKVNLTFLKP
jgi:zinc/manganese transport system permease protein